MAGTLFDVNSRHLKQPLHTFADDIAIPAVDKNLEESTRKLQNAANSIVNCTQKWKMNLDAKLQWKGTIKRN